mgnify:CR=1 FL=1
MQFIEANNQVDKQHRRPQEFSKEPAAAVIHENRRQREVGRELEDKENLQTYQSDEKDVQRTD